MQREEAAAVQSANSIYSRHMIPLRYAKKSPTSSIKEAYINQNEPCSSPAPAHALAALSHVSKLYSDYESKLQRSGPAPCLRLPCAARRPCSTGCRRMDVLFSET